MAFYAVMNGGVVVDHREISNWDAYPTHKKAARDERGDGGPTLRPLFHEGSGPREDVIIEIDRVRIVRSFPPPSISDVRNEAQRRIIELMGARDFEHCLIKQLNANARAVALTDKRVLGEPLTSEEQAEAQALRSMKTAIDAIRAKSNILEGMEPVPSDYTSDHHWM